jgi:hypothetical protein
MLFQNYIIKPFPLKEDSYIRIVYEKFHDEIIVLFEVMNDFNSEKSSKRNNKTSKLKVYKPVIPDNFLRYYRAHIFIAL